MIHLILIIFIISEIDIMYFNNYTHQAGPELMEISRNEAIICNINEKFHGRDIFLLKIYQEKRHRRSREAFSKTPCDIGKLSRIFIISISNQVAEFY